MKRLIAPFLICAALLAAALLSIYALFVHAGPLVEAQDNSVGEMLLDEGLRLERNGAIGEALAKYHLAEQARFQGAKNLRHLHLRLGMLEAGPEHFALALEDDALAVKDPALWRQAWEGHCEAQVEAAQWDRLEAALRDWEAREESLNRAAMLRNESGRCGAARDYFRGVAAQEAGELGAAEDYFVRGCVDGYAAPRAALAALLHLKGGNTDIIHRLEQEAMVMSGAVP